MNTLFYFFFKGCHLLKQNPPFQFSKKIEKKIKKNNNTQTLYIIYKFINIQRKLSNNMDDFISHAFVASFLFHSSFI